MLVDVLSMMYIQDLNGLRVIENDLWGVVAKTVDPFEKNTIQDHIVLIETKRSELRTDVCNRVDTTCRISIEAHT